LYINIVLFVWLLMAFIRVEVVFQRTAFCVLGHPKLHLGMEFKRRVKRRENLSFTLCVGSLLKNEHTTYRLRNRNLNNRTKAYTNYILPKISI